jgi:hypothetical protein
MRRNEAMEENVLTRPTSIINYAIHYSCLLARSLLSTKTGLLDSWRCEVTGIMSEVEGR